MFNVHLQKTNKNIIVSSNVVDLIYSEVKQSSYFNQLHQFCAKKVS